MQLKRIARNVHARRAHCYFLCVFSHDKQETDDVVQLQEGGKSLFITLTGVTLHWRIIYGPIEVETTPSNQSYISGHFGGNIYSVLAQSVNFQPC